MGYRKALEFLLKDYLISQEPGKKEEISSSFLGACLKKYIDDSRIKQCAARAVWLGNDETHYSRKWKDRDINDLKTLMELTLHWISMEFLTKKYKDGMPSSEKRKDE